MKLPDFALPCPTSGTHNSSRWNSPIYPQMLLAVHFRAKHPIKTTGWLVWAIPCKKKKIATFRSIGHQTSKTVKKIKLGEEQLEVKTNNIKLRGANIPKTSSQFSCKKTSVSDEQTWPEHQWSRHWSAQISSLFLGDPWHRLTRSFALGFLDFENGNRVDGFFARGKGPFDFEGVHIVHVWVRWILKATFSVVPQLVPKKNRTGGSPRTSMEGPWQLQWYF